LTQPTNREVSAALTAVAREESGRVVALLAHRFGSLDLADDAVQDALEKAASAWLTEGIPMNPGGWLHVVARRNAIDRLRRMESAKRRTMAAAHELTAEPEHRKAYQHMNDDAANVGDEHLRLMLLCCHPALDRNTQVALTLRLVGGLTTPEIASAFLVPEATLAQRIVRAKRKIQDAGIPLSIPEQITDRIDAVLHTLYLIFNEGYLSHSNQPDITRIDLADEAIRLTTVLDKLLPETAEIEGLLALELFNRSRVDARLDSLGELVLLEDQDRTTWDRAAIERANALLAAAMARMQPGAYQLQAIIAAHHANARTAADTDWPMIASLYRQLCDMTASPVVALNHAVAVAMADGPHAGLALLDQLRGLDGYHLFHAARGELLHRCGNRNEVSAAFRTALSLTENPSERRHLARRLSDTS
jgi:RNA polymerase sigma-70 factor, ECF subfamily